MRPDSVINTQAAGCCLIAPEMSQTAPAQAPAPPVTFTEPSSSSCGPTLLLHAPGSNASAPLAPTQLPAAGDNVSAVGTPAATGIPAQPPAAGGNAAAAITPSPLPAPGGNAAACTPAHLPAAGGHAAAAASTPAQLPSANAAPIDHVYEVVPAAPLSKV